MISIKRLASLACVCSLLIYTIPSIAAMNSGNLRPPKGTTLVYESYISNDKNECKTYSDYSPAFTGGFSVYIGSKNDPVSGKPMNINCPSGYAMVNMSSQTSGGFVAAAGGQINNNSSVSCCPIKYRWAPPKATA